MNSAMQVSEALAPAAVAALASRSPRVALIGMPGAGKTTLGAALAGRLGWAFRDSDQELERRAGRPISELFALPGFRDGEATVIDELTRGVPLVLATGGGAVLRTESRARLRSRCTVVYLSADPHELWRRTRGDRSRPLLRVVDPLAVLQQLHRERDPLYQVCAHIVLAVGGLTPQAVLDAAYEVVTTSGVPAAASVAGTERT